MCEWPGELVAHAHILYCTSFEFAVGAVRVACALLLRIFFAFCVQRLGESDRVRDFGSWELEFGFLLGGCVGRGCVSGEGVEDILLVALSDLSGKGIERGKGVVGYGEGLLLLRW